MGTNFYTMNPSLPENGSEDFDDPRIHVGKRSAAGLYCWTCRLKVPRGATKCPACGAEAVDGSEYHAGKVELGFQEPVPPWNRKGVQGCSEFAWAQSPYGLCDHRVVWDEHGRQYSLREFRERVLLNCPVRVYEHIGEWFS